MALAILAGCHFEDADVGQASEPLYESLVVPTPGRVEVVQVGGEIPGVSDGERRESQRLPHAAPGPVAHRAFHRLAHALEQPRATRARAPRAHEPLPTPAFQEVAHAAPRLRQLATAGDRPRRRPARLDAG